MQKRLVELTSWWKYYFSRHFIDSRLECSDANMGYNFVVELCPKLDKYKTDAILTSAQNLIDLCDSRIILTSHTIPGTTTTGLSKAINFEAQLRRKKPIFTLTCHDVNKINIDRSLEQLQELGIKNLLVVTGENYSRSEINKKSHFKNSEHLISYIGRQQKVRFDSIGLATYPANGVDEEIRRLQTKLANIPVNTINSLYFQYVEDLDLLADFSCALANHSDLCDMEKCYYVPIYESPESYLNAMRLMKIPQKLPLFFDKNGNPLGYREYKTYSRDRIHSYFVRLGSYKTNFIIGSFGLYEFACTIIEQLQQKYPQHEQTLQTKTTKLQKGSQEPATK